MYMILWVYDTFGLHLKGFLDRKATRFMYLVCVLYGHLIYCIYSIKCTVCFKKKMVCQNMRNNKHHIPILSFHFVWFPSKSKELP